MKEWIATVMVAGSMIALVSFFAGMTTEMESWESSGLSTPIAQVSPLPTVEQTAALSMTMW